MFGQAWIDRVRLAAKYAGLPKSFNRELVARFRTPTHWPEWIILVQMGFFAQPPEQVHEGVGTSCIP